MIVQKHFTEFALSCMWQGEHMEFPVHSGRTMNREAKLLHKRGATNIQGWRRTSQGWIEDTSLVSQVAELPIRKKGGPDFLMYGRLINLSEAARAAAHIARQRHLTEDEMTSLSECIAQIREGQ